MGSEHATQRSGLGADDHAFRARLPSRPAERDEQIVAAYDDDSPGLSDRRLRDVLAAQSARGLVHPVFFGSAITGAGVRELMTGIAELLPAATGDPDGAVRGTVFKIERGAGGEKITYVRLFSGAIRTRDRVRVGGGSEDKVTTISVFEEGLAVQRPSVSAGAVAKLWGLADVQVGDRTWRRRSDECGAVRAAHARVRRRHADPEDGSRFRVARPARRAGPLDRRPPGRAGRALGLAYGEVQKEVIEATLSSDFGLDVVFTEATRSTSSARCAAASGRGATRGVESVQRDDRAPDRARA
jgi:ribosomal protection tetracycline resistance protein